MSRIREVDAGSPATPPPAPAGQVAGKARDARLDPALRRLISVILLGGILGILNSTMVSVGIDRLTTALDTSLGTVGWVSSGFLLAVTVTIPVTGWAVDRLGGRRLWVLGLGLFTLGSLAAGLAWNVGSLIAFRLVQGVGAGILDPLVLVLLARAAGAHRAGRVMGLMSSVFSLGPVLGPVVGGIVLHGLDWRWMFLVNVPLGALAILLSLRIMPSDAPPPERTRTRLDVLGVALLGPGFAGVLLTLSRTADHTDLASWSALAPLVIGVVLLVVYAIDALRRRSTPPLIDLRLFARGGFTASVTIMSLTGLSMYASLFVLPLYFQQSQQRGALVAGLLVAPLGVGSALAAPLAGRISDRIGSRNLAVAGGILAALSALAVTRIDGRTAEIWVVLAALAIGVGLALVGPPAMGSLYRALPASLVPQGSSVLYMLNQLGASVGIAVVAVVLGTADDGLAGFHGVYWFSFGAFLVVLAAAAFLPGRAAAHSPATNNPRATNEGASQ
ncbi:DHA2 family efflux MFS transporter permease subunit [Streptoalloteichus hindustanus]|uniref:Drug resistance transporter, EmrB/QacA subfamily n=1 Tax=Streptoalloteichus hindustanus TaxID=2017 RepID=A0A1M4ZHH0_STRHI|nr:DHA2 family efflux MFS transporter permease subunit [Streptoalloteichus hindustanus]SHF17490.1 drug resistance transporter, EmrB/QacA subfamily [Streptoalloteichus hindustanus]